MNYYMFPDRLSVYYIAFGWHWGFNLWVWHQRGRWRALVDFCFQDPPRGRVCCPQSSFFAVFELTFWIIYASIDCIRRDWTL